MKYVFMDYASTTPVDPAVVEAMTPYFTTIYGNPSSIHHFGIQAKQGLDKARKQVAGLLNAQTDEIVFTAGGTEADNMAIKGVAWMNKTKREHKGPHIITSAIEHPGVLETCKHLELHGFKVKYLPVDHHGLINLNELENSLSPNTFLITIMYANNEIGTIEPIKEIGKIAHDHNILFHTDAVQAVAKLPIDVKKLHIDMLALSSHKIYGPKGVGALYVKEDVKLQPIIHGGGHERGLRSSTHNMPGVVGLGKACELAQQRMKTDIPTIQKLRDELIQNVLQIEETYLNGHPTQRLINNAHFRFTAIEGESLLLSLDEHGIAASTGSACSSRKQQASHVLTAIDPEPENPYGSIRLTLGRHNTKEEVQYVSETLTNIVKKLRHMSPLWNR